MELIISGSIAYDYIMDFDGEFTDHILPDQIHKLNISFVIDKLQRHFGGVGTNIAYTLNLLETDVDLVGIVGNDFEAYKAHLDAMSYVNIEKLIYDKEELTASAYINSDKKSNQITAFYPGASKNPYKLSKKDMGEYDWALVGPENKQSMINNVEVLSSISKNLILDSGQMTPYFTREEWLKLFEKVNVLIVNDYEMELVQNNSGLVLEELNKQVETIIVTKGAEGSEIYHKGEMIKIPAVKTDFIVDPTGAGDAYRAGLLAGLTRGFSWEISGKMASLAGVYAVEKRGTQVHKFALSEFVSAYEKNFNDKLNLR